MHDPEKMYEPGIAGSKPATYTEEHIIREAKAAANRRHDNGRGFVLDDLGIYDALDDKGKELYRHAYHDQLDRHH